MYRQSHDSSSPRIHSTILSDTTQQVSAQLVIVSKLKEQNEHYLTKIEKGWIDSIVNGAKRAIEDLGIPGHLAAEAHGSRHESPKSPIYSQQFRSVIQLSSMTTQNLTQLLAVAQTLNSATSLLSCCYERHKWSTRQTKGMPPIEEDPNNDLALLLDRRRSGGHDREPQLTHLAPNHLGNSQASDTMSVSSEERYSSLRSPAESVASDGSHSRSESDGMLSLMVVESLDRWVKNAEIALEVAMQQPSSTRSCDHLTNSHLPMQSFSRTNGYIQTDTSSIASSTSSSRSSNILAGTFVSPRTARLVYLPKTSPQTNIEGLPGLNIRRSPPSSPTPNGSDTTICAVETSSLRSQRRISRGRAWLERQGEAGTA